MLDGHDALIGIDIVKRMSALESFHAERAITYNEHYSASKIGLS